MAIVPTWTMMSYPGKLNLEKLSWPIVSAISKEGLAKRYFNIGDEKIILIDGEEYIAQIIGLEYDDVTTPSSYNNKTKAGITFQLKSVLNYPYAYDSADYDKYHWGDMELRATLNDKIYNSIESGLRNVIIPVDKFTPGEGIYTARTTSDKLFLLSIPEVKSGISYGIAGVECTPYEYYISPYNGTHIRYRHNSSVAATWWSRSCKEAIDGDDILWLYFTDDGKGADYALHTRQHWVSFAFCV